MRVIIVPDCLVLRCQGGGSRGPVDVSPHSVPHAPVVHVVTPARLPLDLELGGGGGRGAMLRPPLHSFHAHPLRLL